MEQARSAAAEGELTVEPQSALDKIRSTIGKEALDLILDLIGITDVLKCFHGEFSGCIWAAVGILPIGKAGKLLKAMPAVRKLIAKSGDIKRAFQTSWVKTALDDALIPAACRLTSAATTKTVALTHAIYRTPTTQSPYATAASKCPIPATVKKINGRYPINARYAGGFWRNGDPAKMPEGWPYGKIRFTEEGFPDFSENIWTGDPQKIAENGVPDIKLDSPSGIRDKDITLADKKYGIDEKYREENQLVWHHHEDFGRMQLVPQKLHQTVRHTGGFAIWGKTPTI